MHLAGITDIHIENLIIHRLRAVLIDLEVSFSFTGFRFNESGAFSNDTGAMKNNSSKTRVYKHIKDIFGISPLKSDLNYPEKNRLFYYQSNIRTLYSCQPQKDVFLNGYRLGLEIMQAQWPEITKWLHCIEKRNIPLRVLPESTREFIQLNNFSHESFSTSTETLTMYMNKFKNGLDTYESQLTLLKNDPKASLANYPLPRYAIYSNKQSISYLMKENQAMLIPWYYTFSNEQQLFNSMGIPVTIPTNLSEKSVTLDYLPQSPIQQTQMRLVQLNAKLRNNVKAIDQLIENLNHEIGTELDTPKLPVEFFAEELESSTNKAQNLPTEKAEKRSWMSRVVPKNKKISEKITPPSATPFSEHIEQ